jgi:hypothetical protein
MRPKDCSLCAKMRHLLPKEILSLDFSFLTLLTPLCGDRELGRSFILKFYKEYTSVLVSRQESKNLPPELMLRKATLCYLELIAKS